jgi:hypothetical protein
LALVKVAAYALISDAKTRLDRSVASSGIVPEPENGSPTRSPGREYRSRRSWAITLFSFPI